MGGAEAAILDGFVTFFILRDQDVADTISLSGKATCLATATGRRVHQFRNAIAPALTAERGQ